MDTQTYSISYKTHGEWIEYWSGYPTKRAAVSKVQEETNKNIWPGNAFMITKVTTTKTAIYYSLKDA